MFENTDPKPREITVLSTEDLETIIPLGDHVLVKPDEPKRETKAGILLPDSVRIPRMRGRVLAVSYFVVQQYEAHGIPDAHRVDTGDRVLFHFGGAMPTNFEADAPPVLVPISNILGKVKKDGPRSNVPTEAGVGS